jgi:hypothetical protein
MTAATITGGTIIGLVALVLGLMVCLAWAVIGTLNARDSGNAYRDPVPAVIHIGGASIAALAILGGWWWAMAFTTSGDYHAWNIKQGTVERISKRLVSAGDKGMQERFVAIVDGQPLGIDDTRASLLKTGDRVRLKCKKDYQWGVDRSAHGWACRWAMGDPASASITNEAP